jgi:DNA integrity scanning protein DisA with diadenylate cyclase activity
VRQRRGTTVVISERARDEAVRLGNQSLRLEPFALTPEAVPMLTAIDGAVLMDPEGRCHAIGVILDGRASRRGDPARGARFNSAVRYVDGSDHACVAIVISEEGGVDLLRPLA